MTKNFFKDKKILITGGCGTVGSALIKELLEENPEMIVFLDNSENKIYDLGQTYRKHDNVKGVIGDIRNIDSLLNIADGMDVIFHGAALKHVYLGEQTPDEVVSTNILGVQNVIKAAKKANVERVVFMSSDKAVNPTNVMGTSKLMGEKLISAANFQGYHNTIFSSTRFGNVLGSSGSVLPTIMHQIRNKIPLTLTDPAMTRFVMTSAEAVKLLLQSCQEAKGGEIMVTKMPVVAIKDLIDAVVDLYAPMVAQKPEDIIIETVGKRLGEKLYEELLNLDETTRTHETDNFFIIESAINPNKLHIKNENPLREYRSDLEDILSVEQIKQYFKEQDLLAECARS